ncbi:BMC domain-containing protein [bacterium]|nr:BMC domain-containing protein [bacterium]
MIRYHAIALIEYKGIAIGVKAADAMVKKAPIAMLKAGTVHRGKYLTLIGGSVASVEESFREGLDVGGKTVVDKVLLPDVHEQVLESIFGFRQKIEAESLGVIETSTISATVAAADAAVKGAAVNIIQIRLGDGLGGKAFTILAGKVEDVEAAVEIGTRAVSERNIEMFTSIIPKLHFNMIQEIDTDTRFHATMRLDLPGEEES